MDKSKRKIILELFATRDRWSPEPFIVRKGRDRLGELTVRLGLNKGVEIGVNKGDFSVHLCKSNPNLHMTCVDWWKKYGILSQKKQDAYYAKACENLKPFNTTIIRESSLDALKHFGNGAFDFLYIDGDHTYDGCSLDLILWSRKVRQGGIIALHDYHLTSGVGAAVEGYIRGHRVEQWFKTNERHPTVFWVH